MDPAALLARHWDLADAAVGEIGSFEDRNFDVRVPGGGRYVLKCERRDEASLALEHAAIATVAAALPELALPAPVPALGGMRSQALDDGSRARLLRWVPGTVLCALPDLDDRALRALGALAGRVGAALVGLNPGPPPADSRWDPRHAVTVVEEVLLQEPATSPEETEALRAGIAELPAAAERARAAGLPLQVVHGDVTDHNTLAAPGAPYPVGLIDFGDVCVSWRLADLAAAVVAIACRRPEDPLPAVVEVVGGYHDVAPLSAAELDLLWPLLLARAAACAALSVRQRRLTPASAYVADMDVSDWRGLRALLGLATGLGPAAVRVACGAPPLAGLASAGPPSAAASPAAAPPVRVLDPAPGHVLDLGVASPLLGDGPWPDFAALRALVGDRRAYGRWGEVRLDPGGPTDAPPPTLQLGADVFAPAGTAVRAPLPATVVAADADGLWLALDAPGPAPYLRLSGVDPVADPGARLAAGAVAGRIAERADGGPDRVRVQLAAATDAPAHGLPSLREAWLALCPDPSPLLGTDVSAPATPDPAAQRTRRARVLAGAQELYYRNPLQTVRGRRQYLYDEAGRPYLDMVNNIASIGHSHPRVTAAAIRQLRLLNTNSRFLYASMATYAERLVALVPHPLDTVFLVNSGSEACDLALQIARAATGRHHVVALQGAYHGWTGAVYETCTSPADNPGWADSKPPWVHLAAQPDPYRGRFGEDASAYAESVADACAQAPPAAFISESMLGNQGAVELPPGYLAAAYAAVREAGGVCIADEIQVGCARTGETFWAFEHEGVVPDVVTVAKAAGNGHPVGAVICRRELADALGARAAFFSSTGGGPVSCEIGIAVLDVIADERLQDNARVLGARLRAGLEDLAERHRAIGAVHGRGLYLGVDLVADRVTREPDRPRALAVCERMRRLGVIVQPTGDAGNVLKVKPPLCLDATDADRFLACLDRALGDVAAWA